MLTTLENGFFLGIDSGATSTKVAIVKESGFVVGVGEAGNANLHNVSFATVFENIERAISSAVSDAKGKHPEIDIAGFEVACLGIAGLDTAVDRQNFRAYINSLPGEKQTFGSKKLIITGDGLTGLMSGSDKAAGICLIAATGANCYGISYSGKEVTAGNWGYLLGDQGSAFNIGRAILNQVMKEYDGRLPKSKITTKVLEFLKLNEASELVNWVYRGEIPVREIASLAQLCNDPECQDMVEIGEIVNNSIRELTSAYQAVVKRLGFYSTDNLPVVFIGGLFKMSNRFTERLTQAIKTITPGASIVIPDGQVAEGAARIARMHSQLRLFPETLIVIIQPKEIMGNQGSLLDIA